MSFRGNQDLMRLSLATLVSSSEVADLPPSELMTRCAKEQNDSTAWNQFLSYYSNELSAGVCQVIGFPPCRQFNQMYEDIMQQVWVRLLKNERRAMLQFRGSSEGELRVYLRRVGSSVALNSLRRTKVKSRQGKEISKDCPDQEPLRNTGIKDDSGRIILQATIDRFLQHELRGRNKSRNILVFKLHLYGGLNSNDIAEIMGLNVTARTVDNQLSRIRRRLRRYLSSIN